jgi:hypothetical protein
MGICADHLFEVFLLLALLFHQIIYTLFLLVYNDANCFQVYSVICVYSLFREPKPGVGVAGRRGTADPLEV